jgi:hypothetical protein
MFEHGPSGLGSLGSARCGGIVQNLAQELSEMKIKIKPFVHAINMGGSMWTKLRGLCIMCFPLLICLSWRLEPMNDMPHFTSLFNLCLEVISKFKPSQL